MNKISIITVSYNAESEIENTISSVLSQSYKNIEYILIDGGSADGTVDIIKKYEDRIAYWISEKDSGIYDAMNKGIRKATGDWLNFMNVGDVFANSDVLSSVFSIDIPERKKFLYSDYYIYNKKGELIMRNTSFQDGIVLHQSTIYRKELHNLYGMYISIKPYTVSDLIFFLSVPDSNVMKVEVPISINSMGGLSQQGVWCLQKKLCTWVIFNKISFWGMILSYIHSRIKFYTPSFIKKVVKLISLK